MYDRGIVLVSSDSACADIRECMNLSTRLSHLLAFVFIVRRARGKKCAKSTSEHTAIEFYHALYAQVYDNYN